MKTLLTCLCVLYVTTGCASEGAFLIECNDSCDELALFQCIAPADVTRCRGGCDEVDVGLRRDFIACEEAATPGCTGSGAGDCLAIIGAGNDSTCSGSSVTQCEIDCELVHDAGCFDATTLAACQTHCRSSSRDACTSFSSCSDVFDSCDVLLDCWDTFRGRT